MVTKIKFYYKTLLTDKFNPKTIAETEKVKGLEKLFVKYIFVRLLEDISDTEVEKLERGDFRNSSEVAEYLRKEIPNFEQKFRQYTSEFLKKYA